MHSAIHADQLLRSVALAVARNAVGAMRPENEVAASEGITVQELRAISQNPQFQRYVDTFTTELRDSGFSFAAKCRVLAEDLLPNAYHMVKDPDVPAAVRAKVIENLVEWADLKPKRDTGATNQGAGFSITINLPSAAQIAQGKTTEIVEVTTVDEPLTTSPTPQIAFEEPEDYEYAGDDIYA